MGLEDMIEVQKRLWGGKGGCELGQGRKQGQHTLFPI